MPSQYEYGLSAHSGTTSVLHFTTDFIFQEWPTVRARVTICSINKMQTNISKEKRFLGLSPSRHAPPAESIEWGILTLQTWQCRFEVSMGQQEYLLQFSARGRSPSWACCSIGRCSQRNMACTGVFMCRQCFPVWTELRRLFSDARGQVRQQCGKGV